MKFITYLLIGSGAMVVLIGAFIASALVQTGKTQYVNEYLSLENRLAIPPLLTPRLHDGEKVFDLAAEEGTTEFFSGKQATTRGFNGSYLGPTIRAHTGDKVRINVTNSLGETTTVHWHGMHLPAAMDGGPHQTIPSHEAWQPAWTITNEAATLWYHPHQMEKTGVQVYQGLAGLFIVDDENSDALDLPKNYGVDDIPLVVQDRKFDSNGHLVYDHAHFMNMVTAGMLGDTIVVNGTRAPYVDVPAKLIRLRLLNGANARRYNFGFSDNRIFYQIATDGGLLDAPVERNRVQLSPGERAEIVVDLSEAQDPLTLMSYPVAGDTNKVRSFALRTITGATDEQQQFKILEMRPTAGNFVVQKIPEQLNKIKRFNEADAVTTRVLRLGTATINGKKMDSMRVDEIVKKGDLELWVVRNEDATYHPFHIHGVQFLVLERNGEPPPASETGWKDTISLNPAETVRLAMQFTEYADSKLPYMFHCHILEHEDMGMMGQFVVVDDPSETIELRSPLLETPEEYHMMH